MADWRYEIQHGPDGEANYAFVFDADGALVSNLRIHHAVAVVDAMNRRAPSAEPRQAVRALEWAEQRGYAARAVTEVGIYAITHYAGMSKPFKLEGAGAANWPLYFRALPEAKAAAQADYERRILSALTAVEPTEAEVERALDWYGEQAEAAKQYMAKSDAAPLEAILTVLALDGGTRARAALATLRAGGRDE